MPISRGIGNQPNYNKVRENDLSQRLHSLQANPIYKQITLTYARCFQCKQEKFGNASENWMNFQQTMPTDETFKTTSQISFNDMGGRTDPFALRQNATTGNQAALDEYREKYTKSNHNFKRTYLGASNWKKSD